MNDGYGVHSCFEEVYWGMQHASDSPRVGHNLVHMKGNLEGLVSTG